MSKKIIFYIPSIEGGGVEKNLFLLSNIYPKKINKIYIITAHKKRNNSKKNKIYLPELILLGKKKRSLKNVICIYLLIKNFWLSKAIILSFQSNLPL